MKIKDAIRVIICLSILWCIVCAIRPYWDKYWLAEEIRVAAIYGTKNSVEDTRKLLSKKMEEKGLNFGGEDFTIVRDGKNNVTVRIEYIDEITIFGVSLKELEFRVEKTVAEVEEMF